MSVVATNVGGGVTGAAEFVGAAVFGAALVGAELGVGLKVGGRLPPHPFSKESVYLCVHMM